MTIVNVTAKDYGTYRCVAKNPFGEAEGTITFHRKSLCHAFICANPFFFYCRTQWSSHWKWRRVTWWWTCQSVCLCDIKPSGESTNRNPIQPYTYVYIRRSNPFLLLLQNLPFFFHVESETNFYLRRVDFNAFADNAWWCVPDGVLIPSAAAVCT